MRQSRVWGIILLSSLVFGTGMVSMAMGDPVILVLPGEKAGELVFTATAGAVIIEDSSGRIISCLTATASATLMAISGNDADAELGAVNVSCKASKKEKVACRSENSKGEKDPVETILINAGLITAKTESATKEVQGGLVFLLKENLLINCGAVKQEVKGSWECSMSPVLTEVAAGGNIEIFCSQGKGKQKSGTCLASKAACEDLTKNPLLASFSGSFLGAGVEMQLKGSFNKMVFIDD
jgi:hypothetical protein